MEGAAVRRLLQLILHATIATEMKKSRTLQEKQRTEMDPQMFVAKLHLPLQYMKTP